MKKIIFKKLLGEILIFFLVSSLALTLIIWVIQAVNYLDIVTEDGHSFVVYFKYTLLAIPKLFSQSLPFVYFLSIFYIISDYEAKNQLLIYWTNGITKLQFVNKIIQFSLLFLLIQIFFSTFIVPFTQDKSRSFIRNSNLDFFPNLIKPKKFIDTVKGLTIFIDSKNDDGSYNNIVLKDNSDTSNAQIIIAKKGRVSLKEDQKFLILNDGKIIRTNQNKNTTTFNFKTTQLDLGKYSSKTTKVAKIQEISTITLFLCLKFLNNDFKNSIKIKNLNCTPRFVNSIYKELFKRIYMPVYIILIALVASLSILRSKDMGGFLFFKIKIFLMGILFLVISDVSTNYINSKNLNNLLILIFPILSFLIIYQILSLKLKVNK